MRYWLMKSEPADCSINDLAFFYHSSCPEPGIAGITRISSKAYPDATQFDPHSKYYDPKSKPDAPRRQHVDVQLVQKLPLIPLTRLRSTPELAELRVLKRV